MKHTQLIESIALDVETIIVKLPAALRHLEEWTGEYPGSASGAPPSSGGSPFVPPDESPLTRVESIAHIGDPAMRLQLSLLGHLRASALLARSVVASVDGVELPVTPSDDASDLAVLRWAVRRIRVEQPSGASLDRLSRSTRHVHDLVIAYQPPAAQSPSGCRLHRAAGDHAPIDDKHRGVALCHRCGEFRKAHGVDPTPVILRAWSKGIKPTQLQVQEAIKAGRIKHRRRKQRKAS